MTGKAQSFAICWTDCAPLSSKLPSGNLPVDDDDDKDIRPGLVLFFQFIHCCRWVSFECCRLNLSCCWSRIEVCLSVPETPMVS
jgi:hypothetical protein